MKTPTTLITGASRGIGAALTLKMATQDPARHLLLVSRGKDALAEQVAHIKDLGGRASFLSADLSDADDVESMLDRVKRDHPGLDGVVLAAGYARTGDFLAEDTLKEARYEMRLNYEAPLRIIQSLLPHLVEKKGYLVAISSLTALVPFPGHATYSASKAALAGLVRSLGAEYAEKSVHLGLVLPGLTATEMTEHLETSMPAMEPEAVAEAVLENIRTKAPLTIPGATNKMAAWFFQLFPSLSQTMLQHMGSKLVPSAPAKA